MKKICHINSLRYLPTMTFRVVKHLITLNYNEKAYFKFEVLDRYKWPVIMYKKLTNDGDEQIIIFIFQWSIKEI
jgi:hypothetical protein